ELLRHLGGRHVLALPAEGVADAVDEVEEALLVLAHQVAGPDPGVALCEDVTQDSLLGFARTGVALEPAAGTRRIVLHLDDPIASPGSLTPQRLEKPASSRRGTPLSKSKATSAGAKRCAR